jgi:tetratricopeptide (TPR) repeat protein
VARRRVLIAVLASVCAMIVGLGLSLRMHAIHSSELPGPDSTVAVLSAPPVIEPTDVDPAIISAVESARATVARAPTSAADWGRLGMVLDAHRFFAEASICFGQAERLDPRDARWPYYRGRVLIEEDLDAAINELRRAATLAANTSDVPRLLLADLLLERGFLDEAAQYYRAVLQASPGHPRAQLGLARAAYAKGDLTQALAILRTSCATDPHTRKAAGTIMSEIHRHQGEVAVAERELKAATELPPDAAWPNRLADDVGQLQVGRKANCDRARQLYDQGHRQEAIDLLRRTVRDYPHSDVAWLMLGQALIGQDEWTGAEQALRTAVREAPDSDENLQYLGMALAGGHDDQAAATTLRKATELRPENVQAQILLGQTAGRLRDAAGSLRAFSAAVRYHPESEEAHLLLAETLSRQGRRAEALQAVRDALQVNPDSRKARDLQQKLGGS